MVEEHVGKKRRKEVRQAITMHEQMMKDITISGITLVIAIVAIFVIYSLVANGVIDITSPVARYAPLGVMIVGLCISTPKASRFWSMRSQYKKHVTRFNISKEDMRALQSQD